MRWDEIGRVLEEAVHASRQDATGEPATYIPELARAPLEPTSAAVTGIDGTVLTAGDRNHRFTLQSSAKLVLLAGLLQERGPSEVFSVVGSEPSGSSFASLARLETNGPWPANPLINAGAIALCSLVEGSLDRRVAWILDWAERLCGRRLPVDATVLASERRTGHRNRAIAHMLYGTGVMRSDLEDTLETYFTLCSLEGDVEAASSLPAILAAGGVRHDGQRVLDESVAAQVVSLMATCGMYDESGTYLRQTGLPAKSGVSGVIMALSMGRAGIAVANARLNQQGSSVRGHRILRDLSSRLRWHFGWLSGE